MKKFVVSVVAVFVFGSLLVMSQAPFVDSVDVVDANGTKIATFSPFGASNKAKKRGLTHLKAP